MRAYLKRSGWLLRSSIVAIALGACSDPVSDPLSPQAGPQFNQYDPARVRLVKEGPSGTSATFSITATGGTLPRGSVVTLPACSPDVVPQTCFAVDIWYATDASPVQITITETGFTGDVVLDRIVVSSERDGLYSVTGTNSVTLDVGEGYSSGARFKNIAAPPPPPPPGEGVAGCTPGFWKQSHHFQYWTAPFAPSTQFSAVFANAFPGQTLLQVVSAGGGGLTALGRHTVAALLNAASSEVDYGWTAQQVVNAFNAAYASGDYAPLHTQFEGLNERDCTVDKSGGGTGG